ncbi:MAG TPA: cyclic nucleotide-binding domain-containing protein [Chloroflexi bacterium]|nr:cyclic nucleotide-binding domain-containing protein [Chloroflexota bacterium]
MNAVLEDNTLTLLQTAFPDLSEADIRALSRTAYGRSWLAGENICLEGEPGTALYVIDSGEVDIIVNADDNQEIIIDTIGPGSYFGEMAFLGGTTRMATIRARQNCRLLEIDQDDFMAVASGNPDLLRRLMRQIIGHIQRTDRAVIHELNVKNEALKEAYTHLEEQEQLRTQFIVTLSHELRTPLTSIRGYLALMNQGAIKGDSLPVAMNSITRNVEKMVGLTNDLLFLYEMHPKAPEFAYLNLADVLIEALQGARKALEDEVTAVSLDIAPDVPPVYGDRQGLTLAVRAFIENAFKYSPDGTPVHIRAYSAGDEVAIAVTDQGIGIPAEAQERIFEPFFRVEREGTAHLFSGLGVGLTIAKFMADRNNGRITVDSAPNEGSAFTLYLPQP